MSLPIRIEKQATEKTELKLNVRQQKFVDEYLIDFNATQAALRAGYSAKTAYSKGHELLKHVEIRKVISEQIESTLDASKSQIKKKLIEFWEGVALGNKSKSMKYKLKASEYLGKYAGAWKDDINVNNTNNVQININLGSSERDEY